MKKYAFIDVPNTTGTTRKLLDFSIDWSRLMEHLHREKWNCESVYFYKGQRAGKKDQKKMEKIKKIGYIVCTKLTHIHPKKVEQREYLCETCGGKNTITIKKEGDHKSNCDVDLTVDAMKIAYADAEEKEFLFFTGDGDFRPLVEDVLERNIVVKIISNKKRDGKGQRRFSTRLQELINLEEASGKKRVKFVDINDWKESVKKQKPPSIVAVSER